MKTTGRDWQVCSLLALLFSTLVWIFIDGQVYDACAYGPEYTLLFDVDDWSCFAALSLALGSSLFGLGCAIRAAFLNPKRELYVLLLITTNLYVSPVEWFKIQHTGSTTDYAVLQEK